MISYICSCLLTMISIYLLTVNSIITFSMYKDQVLDTQKWCLLFKRKYFRDVIHFIMGNWETNYIVLLHLEETNIGMLFCVEWEAPLCLKMRKIHNRSLINIKHDCSVNVIHIMDYFKELEENLLLKKTYKYSW